MQGDNNLQTITDVWFKQTGRSSVQWRIVSCVRSGLFSGPQQLVNIQPVWLRNCIIWYGVIFRKYTLAAVTFSL